MDTQLLVIIAIIVLVASIGAWALVRARRVDDAGEATTPVTETEAPSAGRGPSVAEDRRLRGRLTRTRSALTAALGGVFSESSVSEATWDEIEHALLAADVGPAATQAILDEVKASGPDTGEQARAALQRTLVEILDRDDRGLALSGSPAVIVVVGVNGTGKTTSIAKLARRLTLDGHSVVLGAADTFRAAADTQLRTWGDRVGVPVVSGDAGADPASVAFEALQRARETGADVVIIDTAGRLQSRTNLMDELGKIIRVLRREAGAIDETLLVLDGTVGQNGIAQAAAFLDVADASGVVLTKLDGTARGGVAVAIERQIDIPVKFIGVGEQMDDLIPFEPVDFVDALVAP
jgi:fused signal recognition particle receptor